MLGLLYLSNANIVSSVYAAFSGIKNAVQENVSYFWEKIENIKNSDVLLRRTNNDTRNAEFFKMSCMPIDGEYDFKDGYVSLAAIESGSGFKDDSISCFSIYSESSYSPFPLLKDGKCLE